LTGGKVNKIAALLVVLASFTVGSLGQDLKSLTAQNKGGDTLRYRVEFDGDPQFTSVSVAFYLLGERPPGQQGLAAWFGSISHFVKVKEGVYDVDGVIPMNLASGEYELRLVNTTVDPASKQYDATSMNIHIHIRNDAKYDFPPLKSVKPI
jgi:hypothetical protein